MEWNPPTATEGQVISTNDVWTVGRLLEWTNDYFAKKSLDSPRLDAEILLAHALGCTRIQLYTMYDAEVGAPDRAKFREFVKARAGYKPVAYLVGEREFYGLAFAVTPDVLVPRPETEHLVGAAIPILAGSEAPTFVDVGVGSGAIAVTLLAKVKHAQGIGADMSSAALAVAQSNAEKHGVSERLRLCASDLLADAPAGPFDLIVSNPPYIAAHEWAALPPDVREHEPKLALAAGADGLDCYRRLIPQAAARLKPGGRLLLEIGSTQEEAVRGIIEQTADLIAQPFVKDYGGRPRVAAAVRSDG